jgi:hypothetical protein
LQRVIRAEEKKKKLPKQITRLVGMLDEWAALHSRPFVLGMLRYRDEVLALMEGELQEMALECPQRAAMKVHAHACPASARVRVLPSCTSAFRLKACQPFMS